MLLILGIQMKVLDNHSKRTQYDSKTISILMAVQTWRVVGFAFLWGVGIGIIPPCLWNTRRSRGCSDWTDGYPLCLFLEKRV
jgi:hypothetical protein